MEESQFLKQARTLLNEIRGKKLSVEERREKAIELAKWMIYEARRTQTRSEYAQQNELAQMMEDPHGKVFVMNVTDQCFRTSQSKRGIDQFLYLLEKFGIPSFFSWWKRFELRILRQIGSFFSPIVAPLTRRAIRKETLNVILPGEKNKLNKHLSQRRKEGVRTNLNHLGEAILGEKEAESRLERYLKDLADPLVEYVSIKISTIYSQIQLLAWEETIDKISNRLRLLYRAAMQNEFVRADGSKSLKFVNLDMEEYRDLHMTVAVFRKVLEEPEFFHHSAGIVLQSYLPDSYWIQQELTLWAMQRVASGGAPIKIRIVKGANLAMEQLESALHGWPQAPYPHKLDVDANFKRMMTYACQKDHAAAVHVGIASHNLFDIAYGMLLQKENEVEPYVGFEMLEGMANPIRRVVQTLSGDMLLYCPAATNEEFQNAVAYLVRRLDENTAPDNFLRHMFHLVPGSKDWQKQANLFSHSCQEMDSASVKARRTQNRLLEPEMPSIHSPFQNEPDTDFSLASNRKWIQAIVNQWNTRKLDPIPLWIGGNQVHKKETETREDPSRPGHTLFTYSLADSEDIEKAIVTAKNMEKEWGTLSVANRSELLAKIAQGLRRHRGDLIGAMIGDSGKIVTEADSEVSEAIDFAEYYRRSIENLSEIQGIEWSPKGTVLVAPPWNFPCAIPAGGILAALAAGNCVLFKPARQAVLVGYELVKIFWEAGISQKVLQFVVCKGDKGGSQIVSDPLVNVVILTGGTDTARHLLTLRNGSDLMAETGGKNAIIATSMADRDLLVKNVVYSAFRHAGQKCSACSLLILEAEMYDDPHFWKQLIDATESLTVGSAWNLNTWMNPLILPPGPKLLKGLTTLEQGEEWVVKPKSDPNNPCLWSPGIKKGVKEGSFTHQTELFGPVLGVMRADNLSHALRLANGTPYGLTAGFHSLDEREQTIWLKEIRAGNCYINRGITGAIVRRQPFGGCKSSAFGPGIKVGGPNYLIPLMHAREIELPKELDIIPPSIEDLSQQFEESLSPDQLKIWRASIKSYAYQSKHYFSRGHDPSKLKGQDNFLRFIPRKKVLLRLQEKDKEIDVLRVIVACMFCGTPLEISYETRNQTLDSIKLPNLLYFQENETQLQERIKNKKLKRIRLLSPPNEVLKKIFIDTGCDVISDPVLSHGRLELLHYVREISISIDYHRYGNLGIREKEKRSPLPKNEYDQ